MRKQKYEDNLKNRPIYIIIVIALYISVLMNFGFLTQQNNDYQTEEAKVKNIEQKEAKDSIVPVITEKNGTYTGEKVDGKRQGQGKFTWKNGSEYVGQFVNGKIEGEGTLKLSTGGTYTGTFVNNQRSGQGKFVFDNQDVYEGTWKNDKMSGNGTYTFKNGEKYIGEFKDNKFNGKGTYYIGNNKYTGTWTNNKYNH